MILDLALILLWLAAVYRVWVLVGNPRTVWRTSFTLSLVSVTIALVLYRFRPQIDALTGVWNLSNMLSHSVLVVGLAFLLVYLDALRKPVVSGRRIATHAGVGVAVLVLIVVSWFAAPVHDRPHGDLRGVDGVAAAVYCLAFWVYLAAGLVVLGWTCLAQGRTFRRQDPARSVSLLLIGVSGLAALPVVVLWTVSLTMRHRPGVDAVAIGEWADRLMPWPLASNAVGILSLLVVPYLTALVTASWRWWWLRPLWLELIRRQPEVHLKLKASGGPLVRAQTHTERVIIEIHDALRRTRLDVVPPVDGCPLAAVAAALHRGRDGNGRPADLLPRAAGRDDDIRQIVALARAYRATRAAG